MQTRTIAYIDPEEDLLDLEINEALGKPLASHLPKYLQAIAAQCAMLGVDINNPQNSRKIYFIEDNEY